MLLNVNTIIKDNLGEQYVLDDIIGRGGFGYVFKAHRLSDNKIFAVKVAIPSFETQTSLASFKNEINLALKVTGDNIIRYEYAHDGDTFLEYPPYIIMEFAEGGTLRNFIDEKKKENDFFSNEEIISIFRQLAKGMQDINKHLVHRDIKPENIRKHYLYDTTWNVDASCN